MKKQQYDRSADGHAGERADAANMGLRHTDARTDELIESGGFRDFLRRLFRQNPIAVISALVILAVILMAIFAPWIAPYKEAQQDLTARLKAPSPEHLFGTDELGRDVFTRILYGARVSLVVGLIPSAVSLFIGMTLGLTAGYYGGAIDYIIMRVADVLLSIPSLLLSMVVMYTLGRYANSLVCITAALSMAGWASVARVVRSQALSLKEMTFVEAARSIGVNKRKIMIRHVLPLCIPSLIVLYTLNVPSCILAESTLSFLGVGVQPPAASWGLMVNQSKQFLFMSPWLALAPGLTIMVIVLAFNFLGDGLRDALDPYMQTG